MERKFFADINDEEFIEGIRVSKSVKDALEYFKFSRNSGAMFVKVRKRMDELNLGDSHFTPKDNSHPTYTLDEILIEKSPYKNICSLKKRLVREDKLEYKCEECDNTGIHNDKKLVLQLDHINGICSDHRLHNLRFLCPNCHSQTPTFSGRNIGKN